MNKNGQPMRLRRTLLASIIGLFGILGIPASSIAALSLQPVSGSAIIPREIASVQTERATETAATNLFFPKKAHIGVIGENLAESRLSSPLLAADSQQVALSKWLYNASGYTVAPRSGTGITKASRKRFKRTINNLSKSEQPGLSQRKLDQLRRVADKADAKVRVDLEGVKGTGVRPHAHVEGMGSKVESRHIWLQEGVE